MIPLFTTKQIREADNYAIKKLRIPGIVLMENAAINIFDIIMDYFPDLSPINPIGIVCGKGNNGGDGFALARHFINFGFNVNLVSIGKKSELKGDALINYITTFNMMNNNPACKFKTFGGLKDLNVLKECSIIIDAILGTGTKGELTKPYKSIIKKLNGFPNYKVAIDIPTGLDADNGTGSEIFESDLTVTLAEYKRGLFFGKGYVNSGDVFKGDIGLDPKYFDEIPVEEYLVEADDVFNSLPDKELDLHKYSAGKVLVIAGSGNMPGASFFAANTTLKVGAGSAILAFPKSMKNLAQQKLEGAIVSPYDDDGCEYLREQNLSELKEKINWADVIAIGPGLGREKETVKAVQSIIKNNPAKKFVIDADAVFALGNKKYKKINLINSVLTPHHKEFSELIGISLDELEQNILEWGKKFVRETGSYLVLKGAPTLFFSPFGEIFINTTGNPGMAKFGSGDVLTGALAAMLAQTGEFEEAIISSVYLHGLSADLLLSTETIYGITAENISENLPNAIKHVEDTFIQDS